jgi:hypothetical protein
MTTIRVELPTWSGRKKFQYEGSVLGGTVIYSGESFAHEYTFYQSDYQKLLEHFVGREVVIGTSRTDPPKGSMGDWIGEVLRKTGITSYIGPILIREGYAARGNASDRIRIDHR